MKKQYALLLALASLPICSVSYAQWLPTLATPATSIARTGNVGVGLSAPSSAAKLHLAPGGFSIPGAPTIPLLRLQNNGSKFNPSTTWDIDVSTTGRLTFEKGTAGGSTSTEMYLDDTDMKVYPNNLRIGDDAVRSTLGAIYNFSGTNGMDATYVGFSGTSSTGQGIFASTSNNGQTAIVGDQDGNLKFLTKASGSGNMSWYTDAWMTVKSDGDIEIQQRTETKDLTAKDEVLFPGLNGSTTDLEVLVTDANGKVWTRTLPADVWDGDDTGASAQTLSLSGSTLSISQGNSVSLAGLGDNLGNHLASMNLNMSNNRLVNVNRMDFNGGGYIDGFGGDIVLNPGVGGVTEINSTVGINAPAPVGSSFDLDVLNDIECNMLSEDSDRRLKSDIVPIEGALDKIMALEGVSYKKIRTQREELGFIAQDIQRVLPEVVLGSEENYYSVRYTGVVPVLVEAMQEQQAEIEARDAQIEQLETRLAALEAAILGRSSDAGKSTSDASTAADAMKVFPNPTRGELTIENLTSAAYITITDNQGKQVSVVQTNQENRQQLDVSGLNSGIYFITTQGADGSTIDSARFVKK